MIIKFIYPPPKNALILFVLALLLNYPLEAIDKTEKWSVKIADSFLRNHPDSITYSNVSRSRKWNYEQGLMMEAFFQLWKASGDWKYYDYIKKNLDYYIKDDGSIHTYRISEYNIDNITSGRAALNLYKMTKLEKYRIAADSLRSQLQTHPRTSEGGFWHKKIYPHQMWLDGLYMGEPFYAQYSLTFNDEKAFDDIANQFHLIKKYLKDKKTGLYYHGWDESKKEKWSNQETGTSPNFWGRSIGWFMMSMVDVLDYFPVGHPARKEILSMLKDLSESVLKFKDKKTKLWYQVVDKGNQKGNYIEASSSMMMIYTFAKGANKGYLSQKFFEIAEESFKSALTNLVTIEGGSINLNYVCSVAGLGNIPYRDGSFEYYISEPIRANDFKGYGPFLLSAIELERGKDKKQSTNKSAALDYFFNNEWKNGQRFHYVWEDTTYSGYSDFGKIFEESGLKISKLEKAPTKADLSSSSIYIIVDPDTLGETENPNYISSKDIKEITGWVKGGGVLLLMANDRKNCEFTNFNKLANNFGINFNGDSENRVKEKDFEMGKFDSLPNHPLFDGVNKIYMKEISSLNLSGDAQKVLERDGKIFMAETKFGKGYVIAIGDPWIYNEYLDNRKIPESFENYKAARNLVKLLIDKIPGNK